MNKTKSFDTLAIFLFTLLPFHLAIAAKTCGNDSLSFPFNEVVFDCSLFPASEASSAYSWSPTFAFRSGISRTVVRTINVEAYLEYYEFRLPTQEGNTSFSPAGTKRQDFAAYVGLSLSRILLVGAGTYYMTSPPVTWFDPLMSRSSYPWESSGFSEFRFFWTIGFNVDIHILDRFYMPIGLCYRNGYQGGITFFRIGSAFRF